MRCFSHRNCSGPLRWAAVLSMSLGLLACSGSHEPRRMSPSPAGHVHVAPTTNVPALLGISIDELRQRLGPPQPLPAQFTSSEASALLYTSRGRLDSLLAFRTGGLLLLATYNAQSRRVRDFLLLGHHEDSLMGRARLRPSAGNYLLMPVFGDSHSFRLLGLRVIPTK
jgi:hypothetical protein